MLVEPCEVQFHRIARSTCPRRSGNVGAEGKAPRSRPIDWTAPLPSLAHEPDLRRLSQFLKKPALEALKFTEKKIGDTAHVPAG